MMAEKIRIDKSKIKRTRGEVEEKVEEEPASVSAGAVEKALDLAFNPTREKIREVTVIDRLQGRMFPLLDVINSGQKYILEVAMYRQDEGTYRKEFNKKRPVSPNWLEELMYRTAQWQKSVQGTNLTKITDIALAEVETKAGEEELPGGADIWKE